MDTSNLDVSYRMLLSENPGVTPTRALTILRDHLCRRWSGQYFANLLPAVGADPVRAYSNGAASCGLSQYKPVIRQGPAYKPQFVGDPPRVMIHWPTLLRTALDAGHELPALALFLLQFRKVIRQKSPFAAEALARYYRLAAYDVLVTSRAPSDLSGQYDPRMPKMSPAEREALRRQLVMLSDDVEFIQALQQVCHAAYFPKATASVARTTGMLLSKVDSTYKAQGSVLVLDPSAAHAAEFDSPLVPPSDFSCMGLNGILTELWVAHGLGTFRAKRGKGETAPDRKMWKNDIVGALGVAVVGADEYLVIHWEWWLKYREEGLCTQVYEDYVHPRRIPKAFTKHYPLEALLGRVLPRVRDQYSSIFLPFSVLSDADDKMFRSYWSQTTDDNLITVISIKTLRTLCIKRYKLSLIQRPPHNPATVVKKNEPLYYDAQLPLQPSPGTDSYPCVIIHAGNRIMFQPAWDMSEAQIYVPSRRNPDKLTRRPNPGVLTVPPDGTRAYSAEFLLNRVRSPGTPLLPDVRRDIGRVGRFTRKMLENLIEQTNPSPTPKPLRLRSPWTYEEDLAIKRLYRPKMSDADKEELYETCSNRNQVTISQRASQLRSELIAKGVYDINDLPHKRYNHLIGREISGAKKAAEEKE